LSRISTETGRSFDATPSSDLQRTLDLMLAHVEDRYFLGFTYNVAFSMPAWLSGSSESPESSGH
jgi:hypothetical protein